MPEQDEFQPGEEPSLPLQRHQVLRTRDVDQMREESTKLFCTHRLDPKGTDRVLDARLHSARLRQVAVNYMQYGADVTVTPGELGSFYLVHIPLHGTGEFTCGTDRVGVRPGKACVPAPFEHLSMDLKRDSAYLVIRIDRRGLEAELHDLLHDPLSRPLRFDPAMDLAVGLGQSWWNYVRRLADDLAREENLAEHEFVTSMIEHVVMTGLLTAQPHNYTSLLTERVRLPPPQTVRQAVDLIEGRPDTIAATTDLARRVGVSARTLQTGFRRYLDTTPTEYLRLTRIKRAHADLQDATEATTVSEVASRWGFGHLGRFAAEYRKRYGERPVDTLQRATGRS